MIIALYTLNLLEDAEQKCAKYKSQLNNDFTGDLTLMYVHLTNAMFDYIKRLIFDDASEIHFTKILPPASSESPTSSELKKDLNKLSCQFRRKYLNFIYSFQNPTTDDLEDYAWIYEFSKNTVINRYEDYLEKVVPESERIFIVKKRS